MAKRYHQSKEDKMHESKGMHEAMHRKHYMERDEHYSGHHARRKQEMEDAGMIREDHNEIANLPQEVMIKAYPKTGPYMPEMIDDTIRGIDRQMDEDDRQRRKTFNPKKV